MTAAVREFTRLRVRFLPCSDACMGRVALTQVAVPTSHTTVLDSVYWTCSQCGSGREGQPCTQEDLLFDPAPAGTETANSSVSSTEDSPAEQCSICRGADADVKAYYAELGRTAQLLPWCYGCLAATAGLVVGAGYPLTIMPIDPIIPGYYELRAELDRIQAGDDSHAGARAEVRRLGPPRRAQDGTTRRAPMGRKPGEWA